jgi:hypothetical protein
MSKQNAGDHCRVLSPRNVVPGHTTHPLRRLERADDMIFPSF